jgi:unsaturated rhamnogalacturonyl hydrolase
MTSHNQIYRSLLNFILVGLALTYACSAQTKLENRTRALENPWSVRMADSFMKRYPNTISYPGESKRGHWTYEQGVMLEAIRRMWVATGDEKYFSYVKRNIDEFVGNDGSIRTYEYSAFNLDNIPPGRQLLMLYQNTHDEKYRKASDELRRQLANQPRTHEGGFWHKKIYPYQMWLDGIYMAEPFYAEYALMFKQPSAFDDVADQTIFLENHTRDPQTGLLYHGWDESKERKWANPVTGCSPSFWGRGMGWYAMGIVDVLDFLPQDNPKRARIIEIFQRLCKALAKFQDSSTGLWYQVVDQGNRKGNYVEASASCMFAYVFAKGTKKGYLEHKFLVRAEKAFKGVVRHLVTIDEDGSVSLHQTCQSAGLGGTPYRDGSYEYYISEPQRTNDFKGIGPFIFAALELEHVNQKG